MLHHKIYIREINLRKGIIHILRHKLEFHWFKSTVSPRIIHIPVLYENVLNFNTKLVFVKRGRLAVNRGYP